MIETNTPILIFDQSVKGHHLEYIHHLYIKALEYPKIDFIFALPNSFLEVKHKLSWPDAPNIRFDLFEEKAYEKKSTIKASLNNCRLLKKSIERNNASQVFLIYLMAFLPFLPFIISKKVQVSGIIYMIYLYRWKEASILNKLEDALKYLLFVKLRIFNKIFILNDSASTRYLNKKFNTNKFLFLPDPYVPISNSNLSNIKEELKISEDKNVFLHFGDLSLQKGTLEILNAIELIKNAELDNLCFIFAGRVNKDIEKEFYLKLNTQNKRTQILFFEGFFDYSFIGSLCMSCDYMLLPYKRTSQSSGLIGYAAQFNKPVLAPNEKLLGKLVRKYNLGVTIKNLNPLSLASTIKDSNENLNWKNNNNYLKINNVANFTNAIFNELI